MIQPRRPDRTGHRLSDPSACVYHAVQELTGVTAGDVVLVTGPGPMGLFSVQYAKANGMLSWVMPAQHTQLSRERMGDGPEISCHVPFILNADAAQARQFAREYLSLWLALPWYRKSWGAAGFSEADFDNGGSDAFIDAVVGWGDADGVLGGRAEEQAAVEAHDGHLTDLRLVAPVDPETRDADIVQPALL